MLIVYLISLAENETIVVMIILTRKTTNHVKKTDISNYQARIWRFMNEDSEYDNQLGSK